jgi:hypothetical protein
MIFCTSPGKVQHDLPHLRYNHATDLIDLIDLNVCCPIVDSNPASGGRHSK